MAPIGNSVTGSPSGASASGMVLVATDTSFGSLVSATLQPLMVVFTDTRTPSRAMRPILADLARDRSGSLVVAIVEVADNPATAEAWGITDAPIVLLLYR